MQRDELFESLKDICLGLFGDDELTLTEETSSSDIEEWDSLMHLSIINELEETYNIGFTLDEVTKARTLGDILDVLEYRLSLKK